MKKLLLWTIVLWTGIAQSQQINTTWQDYTTPIFQGLDNTKVPTGILLDQAMEFADLRAYNGFATDSTAVDIDVFSNIYKTILTGRVTTDTLDFPRFNTVAQKWAGHILENNKEQKDTIVVAGLFYEYSNIRQNALAAGDIRVTNGKYYDKQDFTGWRNPYEKRITVAFTPMVQTIDKANFKVHLPADLWFGNFIQTTNNIQFDAGDGQGYRPLPIDGVASVAYATGGIYEWKFKVQCNHLISYISTTKVKIDIKQDFSANGGGQRNNLLDDVFIPGPNVGGTLPNGAILRIRYAPGHTCLEQPLIVAEGFDAGFITDPTSEGGDTTLEDLINIDLVEGGPALRNLLTNGNRDYDIVYVDWQNGTASIQDNSVVLENVIDWVNLQKQGTAPSVLLGQSMGGLVGRFTLARMEAEGNPHDVDLFISHDAPHRGSVAPLSGQFWSRHMYSEYMSSTVIYGTGEVVVPIVIGLAELISNFLNQQGANTTVDPYVSAEDVLTIQDTPAAVQLNREWVDFNQQVRTVLHDTWQQEYDTMGYPTQCRNIAISNGNECALDQGFLPGDQYLEIDDIDDPDFFGDLLHLLTVPIAGIILEDPLLTILSYIPGESKFFYNVDTFSTPGLNATNRQVYEGKIEYEKTLLWILPVRHTLTSRNNDAPNTSLPFGSYTGGTFDISQITDEFPAQIPPAIVINPTYGFIPVASAIDVVRTGGLTDTDFQRKYAGGEITTPGLSTDFNNFIVDYEANNIRNFEHISFQARNGNWFAAELLALETPFTPNNFNKADCSFFCGDAGIEGDSTICTLQTYTVEDNDNFTYAWSVTPANAANIVGNTNEHEVSVEIANGYNGTFQLQVIVTDTVGDCGNATITKNIFSGVPSTPSQVSGPTEVLSGSLVNYSTFGASGATNHEWWLPYNPNDPDGFTVLPPGEQGYDYTNPNWQRFFEADGTTIEVMTGNGGFAGNVQVMGVNDCGRGGAAILYVEHDVNGDGQIEFHDPQNDDTRETFYKVFPNPTNGLININLIDSKRMPNTNAVNEVALYDMYGNKRGISKPLTLKATFELSGMPTGVYVLKITGPELTEFHQIIVK